VTAAAPLSAAPQPLKPLVAIINATTVLEDAAFPAYVAAQQRQVSGDFAPLWGKDAEIFFVGRGGTPPPGAWHLAFLDDADQAGALGYHDTTADGHPLGKVFVKTTQTYGGIWQVTGSHECLEMLGDPDIVRCVFIPHHTFPGILYAYEAADAVEADQLGYEIDGVTLSDFVTQEWFDPGHYATAYSFRRNVSAPLQLAPGGYIGFYRVGRGSGWEQKTAQLEHHSPSLAFGAEWHGARAVGHQLPHPGSRRERRARGGPQWARSTVFESAAAPGASER
jgi:hypothetical protein